MYVYQRPGEWQEQIGITNVRLYADLVGFVAPMVVSFTILAHVLTGQQRKTYFIAFTTMCVFVFGIYCLGIQPIDCVNFDVRYAWNYRGLAFPLLLVLGVMATAVPAFYQRRGLNPWLLAGIAYSSFALAFAAVDIFFFSAYVLPILRSCPEAASRIFFFGQGGFGDLVFLPALFAFVTAVLTNSYVLINRRVKPHNQSQPQS